MIIILLAAIAHLLVDYNVGKNHHNDCSSLPTKMVDAFVLPSHESPRRSSGILSSMPSSSSPSSGNAHFRSSSSNESRRKTPPAIPTRTSSSNSDNDDTRLLTREEEKSLLLRVHDPSGTPHTVSSSKAARRALLLHNLPLVRSIVTTTQRSRGRSQRHGGVGGRFSGGGSNGGGSTRKAGMSSSHHHGVTAGGSSTGGTGGTGTALTSDDLLHEGTIGLAEAIDRHNILLLDNKNTNDNDNTRLSTYATYWIRARILRAMQSRGEHAILRFPEHVVQASHRLVKSAKLLGLEWEDVVDMVLVAGEDDDELVGIETRKLRDRLCGMANIPTNGNLFKDAVRVRCMSKAGQYTSSLESWMTDASAEDVAYDEEDTTSIAIESYDETLGGEAQRVVVGGGGHIVKTLSKFLIPREIEVLSLRYGLVPPTVTTLSSYVSSNVIENENAMIVVGHNCNDEQQQQHQQQQQQPIIFHDYETEAMNGLFGPQGMLSHYTDASSPLPTSTNNEGVSSIIETIVPAIVSPAVATPPTTSKATSFASSSVESQSLSKTTLSAVSHSKGEVPGMLLPRTTTTTIYSSSSSMPIISRPITSNSIIINSNNINNGKQTLLSFKEIGKRMKFSSEYCRRTCSVALDKLTRAVEEGRLVESDFILGW